MNTEELPTDPNEDLELTDTESTSLELESSDTEEAKSQSKKTEVIEILFNRLWPPGQPRPESPLIVFFDDVISAIKERNSKYDKKNELSTRNAANFLKDFIRHTTCNRNWPTTLKEKKITARQRYGENKVFEFVDYKASDEIPFPDRFDPEDGMIEIPFEALSIPREARALGRPDEPWLIQVIVGQKLIYTHLSVVARREGLHCEALAHLQMSVKTQPEIDATFVATISMDDGNGGRKEIRAYITGEAKQRNERILEDQIREQVAQAFKITAELSGNEAIHAVLPMAFKAISYPSSPNGKLGRRGVYIVQFRMIMREEFDAEYAGDKLHEMPLEAQSRAFYEPHPPIRGISYADKPPKEPKSIKAKKPRKPRKAKSSADPK